MLIYLLLLYISVFLIYYLIDKNFIILLLIFMNVYIIMGYLILSFLIIFIYNISSIINQIGNYYYCYYYKKVN